MRRSETKTGIMLRAYSAVGRNNNAANKNRIFDRQLGNTLIDGIVRSRRPGGIRRRSRLGSLLNYYGAISTDILDFRARVLVIQAARGC